MLVTIFVCCSGDCGLIERCGGFLFQAEDGIRYLVRSRGLGDVYKRQVSSVAASAVLVNGMAIVFATILPVLSTLAA